MKMWQKNLRQVATGLAAIGAVNWGLVALFKFDLVAAVTTAGRFGQTNALSRAVYLLVGVSGARALVAAVAQER